MTAFEPVSAELDQLAKNVIDAEFKVHSSLGPGLLESVYEICLCHELNRRGIRFQRQVNLPVIYDSIRLDAGLRIDVLVEDCLIIELKAVDEPHPLFDAQVMTYLKLSNKRLALLINFNTIRIKDGIKRIVR